MSVRHENVWRFFPFLFRSVAGFLICLRSFDGKNLLDEYLLMQSGDEFRVNHINFVHFLGHEVVNHFLREIDGILGGRFIRKAEMIGIKIVSTEFQVVSTLFSANVKSVFGTIPSGDFLQCPLHNVGVKSARKAFIGADDQIADLLYLACSEERAGKIGSYRRSTAQELSDLFSIRTRAVCFFFCFAQTGSGNHLHCFCDLLDVGDRFNAPFYITRTFQSDHPSTVSDLSWDFVAA